MNEKLLEQKAEEYASENSICVCGEDYWSHKDLVEAYIAGATEETKLLSEHIRELQNDKGKLIDENKELKDENKKIYQRMTELKEKCNSLQELVTYYQTNFCQEC